MRQIYLNNRKHTGFRIERNVEDNKESILINLKPDIDISFLMGILQSLDESARNETRYDIRQLGIYIDQINISLLKYKLSNGMNYQEHVKQIKQYLHTFEKHFKMLLEESSYIQYISNISLILNSNQSLDDLPLLGNDIEINEREDFSRERTQIRNMARQQYQELGKDTVEVRPFTPNMIDQHTVDSEESGLGDANSNPNSRVNSDNLALYMDNIVSENMSIDNTNRKSAVVNLNNIIQNNLLILNNLQWFLDLFTTYTYIYDESQNNRDFLHRNYELLCQLFSLGYQIIKFTQGFNEAIYFIKIFYDQQQAILQIFNNVITSNNDKQILEQIVINVYSPLVKNILFYQSQYEIIQYIFKVSAFLLNQKILVQSILNPQNGMIYQVYSQYITNSQFREKIDHHFIELLDHLLSLNNFFNLINKDHIELFRKIIKYLFDDIMKNYLQNILKLDQIISFNSLLHTYLLVYSEFYDPLNINAEIIKPYITQMISNFSRIKDHLILISYFQLFLSISSYFNEFDEGFVEICITYMLTLNDSLLYWVGNMLNYLCCKSIEIFSSSYERVYQALNKVQLSRNVHNESKYIEPVLQYLVDIAQTLLQQYQQPSQLQPFFSTLQQFQDNPSVNQFIETWAMT